MVALVNSFSVERLNEQCSLFHVESGAREFRFDFEDSLGLRFPCLQCGSYKPTHNRLSAAFGEEPACPDCGGEAIDGCVAYTFEAKANPDFPETQDLPDLLTDRWSLDILTATMVIADIRSLQKVLEREYWARIFPADPRSSDGRWAHLEAEALDPSLRPVSYTIG